MGDRELMESAVAGPKEMGWVRDMIPHTWRVIKDLEWLAARMEKCPAPHQYVKTFREMAGELRERVKKARHGLSEKHVTLWDYTELMVMTEDACSIVRARKSGHTCCD